MSCATDATELAPSPFTPIATSGAGFSSAGELIDRLTWRAVIVILVFFGALLGYRLLASRIPR